MDIFENVMQLATEGCKAVANYIREVRNLIIVLHIYLLLFLIIRLMMFDDGCAGLDRKHKRTRKSAWFIALT